jgi:hypothetical protein
VGFVAHTSKCFYTNLFSPGTVISQYEVEDRKQVAEFDPNAWMEDNMEEEEEENIPCPVCGESDQEEVLLLCDGCDAPYHTHCIGLDRVPRGHWFCMECADEGAYARAAEPMQESPGRRQPMSGRNCPRTLASVRRTRQRLRTDHWYGAWSIFSSRIHDVAGLDLDFSDDDLSMATYRRVQRRTEDERREFQQWQQRLNIAGRQGARDVFRAAAPPRFQERSPRTPVETVEESRAWGALEKAKEMDTTSPRSRKRKSRSVTASPAEGSSEPPKEPERKLKRPRTRRVLDRPESSESPLLAHSNPQPNASNRTGSPSSRPFTDANGQPSFLSSLLKEVEMGASDDETARSAFSATTVSGPNRVTSPSIEYSSPAASPSPPSSRQHTPRALSITPPPHISKRSGSPVPLSSHVEPIYPPAEYSPNRSPSENTNKADQNQSDSSATELRQPRPRRRRPVTLPRSQDTSPVRATMSIEAKEGINKMVKSALAPHWKSAEITKEQYADINRDVSRKLYEIIADRNISDEREKYTWEKIATAEVAHAVKALTA